MGSTSRAETKNYKIRLVRARTPNGRDTPVCRGVGGHLYGGLDLAVRGTKDEATQTASAAAAAAAVPVLRCVSANSNTIEGPLRRVFVRHLGRKAL